MNDFDWFVNFQNEISFDAFLLNFVYKSISLDSFCDFSTFWDLYWSLMMCEIFWLISWFSKWKLFWCFSFKLCLQIDHVGPFLICFYILQIVTDVLSFYLFSSIFQLSKWNVFWCFSFTTLFTNRSLWTIFQMFLFF